MLPKILKNFNVFVDGRGYAGRVEEITLPKLTIKTKSIKVLECLRRLKSIWGWKNWRWI